jgi:hypothetical protein
MARIKIAQGQKNKIKVVVKDTAGAVVDLTPWTKFGFVVYKQPHEVLFRCSTIGSGNWKPITITDAVNGEFEFLLEVDDTKSAEPGNYDGEIIWFEDDGGTEVIPKTPGGMEFMELFPSPTAGLTTL